MPRESITFYLLPLIIYRIDLRINNLNPICQQKIEGKLTLYAKKSLSYITVFSIFLLKLNLFVDDNIYFFGIYIIIYTDINIGKPLSDEESNKAIKR